MSVKSMTCIFCAGEGWVEQMDSETNAIRTEPCSCLNYGARPTRTIASLQRSMDLAVEAFERRFGKVGGSKS
jgi:hypothetical protein